MSEAWFKFLTMNIHNDAAIQAVGSVRRFGDVTAVAGVDLAVAPGEIYGFLGPNGATCLTRNVPS